MDQRGRRHPSAGGYGRGLTVAGGVHLVRSATVRPAVSVTTRGVASVPVSIAEDILATILSILAIAIPVAVTAVIVRLTAFVIWLLWCRARRSALGQRVWALPAGRRTITVVEAKYRLQWFLSLEEKWFASRGLP